MMKPGEWSLYSETDARWRAHGRAIVGGFAKPTEVDAAIERLRKKYGDPPDDLEWSYMKD